VRVLHASSMASVLVSASTLQQSGTCLADCEAVAGLRQQPPQDGGRPAPPRVSIAEQTPRYRAIQSLLAPQYLVTTFA